jgi:hypothetical protein
MGKKIYNRNGVFQGLFKGFSLNILKAPLAGGTSFMIRDIFDQKFIYNK